MSDVQITTPPGVSKAKKTINDASYAFYPPMQLLNSNEEILSYISLHDVLPGQSTPTYEVYVETLIPGANKIKVTASPNPHVDDEEVYTSNATYFSLDGEEFSRSIIVDVDGYSQGVFSFFYRPPSTASLETRTWIMTFQFLESEYPLQKYITHFTVTSEHDEDEENRIITVWIPYEEGKMKPDYGDIRFWEGNKPLRATRLLYNSTGALFSIMMPEILSNHFHLITVLSGNETLNPNPNMVCDEGWDWEDGTEQGWNLYYDVQGYHYIAEIQEYSDWKYCLYQASTLSNGCAVTPAKGVYGTWYMRFKFGEMNYNQTYYDIYFIHDGTNYYKLAFDTLANPPTLTLYHNANILKTVNYNPTTQIHTMTITRNLNNEIIVKIDGSEEINVSDDSITKSEKFIICQGQSPNVYSRGVRTDYVFFIEDNPHPEPIISELDPWMDHKYGYAILGKTKFDFNTLTQPLKSIKYSVRINERLYG